MPKIKRATVNDIPVIISLAEQTWPVTYTPIIGEAQLTFMLGKFYSADVLARQMQEEGQQFVLYCDGVGHPTGFASYGPYGNDAYKLHKLYVLPDLQGRGAGRHLVQWIMAELREQGVKTLLLNVNRYNAGAIGFYERCGFTNMRTEDIDIGNGYFMNDYVYEMALNP